MFKLAIAVLIAAVVVSASGPVKLDECTCFEKGNYYTPISADQCGSFSQRTAFLEAKTQNCPLGLQFDVNVCVCNWPDNVVCPTHCQGPTPPPPPAVSCEARGNIYAPVPGTGCAKFTQATDVLPPQEHNCPAGLVFNVDVDVCVCDWPWRTNCTV